MKVKATLSEVKVKTETDTCYIAAQVDTGPTVYHTAQECVPALFLTVINNLTLIRTSNHCLTPLNCLSVASEL